MSCPGVSTSTFNTHSRSNTAQQPVGRSQPISSHSPAASSSTSSRFLGRHFGRRPKTAQVYSHESALPSSSLQQQQQHSTHAREAPGGLPTSEQIAPSRLGLPRSSSSSHVFPGTASQHVGETNQPSGPDSRSSSERSRNRLGPGPRLRPATANDLSSSSNSSRAFPSLLEPRFLASQLCNNTSSSMINDSSNGGGGGGGGAAYNTRSSSSNTTNGGGGSNPFGRMFRRYSQGAGRLDAQATQSQAREAAIGGVGQQQPRGASYLAENRGRSTPSRASRPASPPAPAPVSQSASYNSLALQSHDSHGAGMANSRTLAVLADEAPSASAMVSGGSNGPRGVSPTSGGGGAATASLPGPADVPAHEATTTTTTTTTSGNSNGATTLEGGAAGLSPNVYRIRLVPHLEATRSLHFEPIERDLREGNTPVKVGRFTDRQPPVLAQATVASAGATGAGATGQAAAEPTYSAVGQPGARGGAITVSAGQAGGAGAARIDSSRVAFKSKVVSRGHAEIWCEGGGKFFIKDTKSSSGTFLNHIRLSAPNAESRPFAIKDGDVIQLGVDYQGGTEEIYRCVKMRVELNRGWQREANQFNINALRQLRALQGSTIQPSGSSGNTDKDVEALPTNRQSVCVTDCCICLFSVTVCQALFIAPCSHVFHYKCIRPLLTLHHPGFSCPLCRTFADLEADVEEDEAWQEALLKEAAAEETRAAHGQPAVDASTPRAEVEAPIAIASALGVASAQIGGLASTSDRTPSDDGGGGGVLPMPDSHQHATPPAPPPSRLIGSGMGRGTAVSALRRAEWARPDTAVGSSVGPLQDVGGEADAAVNASLDLDLVGPAIAVTSEQTAVTVGAATTATDAEEVAVVERMLDGGASPGGTGSPKRLEHGDASALSTLRRGSSGPIEIGRVSAHGRARESADRSSDSAYAAATSRLGAMNPSTPPGVGQTSAAGFPFAAAMSSGLEDSRTPLNNTFLSTLAEAPSATAAAAAAATVATTQGRDFQAGRAAPADRQMPVPTDHLSGGSHSSNGGSSSSIGRTPPRPDAHGRSSGEAEGCRGQLSEGGDETETAENHPELRQRNYVGRPVELAEAISLLGRKGPLRERRKRDKGRAGEPYVFETGEASPDIAERRSPTQYRGRAAGLARPDKGEEQEQEQAQGEHQHQHQHQQRSRSHSHNRGGPGAKSRLVDSDLGDASPSSPAPPSPSSQGVRTGPNINASAYVHGHHHHHHQSPRGSYAHHGGSRDAVGSGGGGGNERSPPDAAAAAAASGHSRPSGSSSSASTISKFKKKFTSSFGAA